MPRKEYLNKFRSLKNACRRCGKTPSPGFKTCERCRTQMREQIARRRINFKQKGLCNRCGVRPQRKNGNSCEACDLKRHPHRKLITPCVMCGFEWADVHHKDKNHKNNDPSNLICLCPNHHRLVHRGLISL